jgi:hypothetical protein
VTDGVTVTGDKELAATMHKAAGELTDMTRAGEKALALVVNRGRQNAPRLSGALASSVEGRLDGPIAAAMSALPYAARVNYGYARYGQRAQPFLTDALVELQGPILAEYDDEADRILHEVRGA